jgi:hypothetical protein
MKKIMTALFFTVLSVNIQAEANTSCADILPQITLQLTAEEWVTTQTAKVSVTLDALLNKEQIAKAQDNFQSALKKIAPEVVWHITEFSRSPGKTSLEQLHAVAEARLPDNALAGLRERVHAQNSEGQTYTIQDIIYSPSTVEINTAKAKLRMQIYDQAKAELDRVNAIYPKPGYSLFNINFVNLTVQPGPMMTKMNTVVALTREMPSVSLSQQITQDALVVFAAPPGTLCSNSR